MELQILSHCGKKFLVGINGKDIRNAKTSGSERGDPIPHMAIGNDEIDDAPTLPDEIRCDICGEMVKVEVAREVKEDKNGI